MTPSPSSWVRLGLLLTLVGAASCGSVSTLGPDGGTAGSSATGAAGTQGAAGSHGAAGTQGTAGSQSAAGAAGSNQGAAGAAGSNQDAAVTDGAAGSTSVDAPIERAASCPATYTSLAHGAPCPVANGTTCDYPEGRCDCQPCSGANGNISQDWACRAWDTGGQGCPPRSPAVGGACNTPGLFCTYGGLCSVSVGDNLQCTAGAWHQMISATGSCALSACGVADAGADHPPDMCAQAGDCPGGACWQQLDGSKACVKPRATPALGTCQAGDATCCMKDGDCAQGTAGRCLPLIDVKENFCGGAIPFGNACRYDQCRTDADCKAAAPAGTTVSACVPSGALNTFTATCVHGGCRTDADCALHASGRCQYGQAATHGVCSLRNVFYCAYPSDPCGNANSPPCAQAMICVPNDNYQGRQCGQPPPAYP